jgi:hypothetical protein
MSDELFSESNSESVREYRLIQVGNTEAVADDFGLSLNVRELFSEIFRRRWFIAKSVAICLVLSIITILISPKEYIASSALMPEYSTESQGGAADLLDKYGGLIGLSGSSYASNSNAIRVDLYPQIVKVWCIEIELLRKNPFSLN